MISLIQDSTLNALISRIPALANAVIISALEGGLTNRNYRIDTIDNSYVLRISGAGGNLLGINRENERTNTRRAHQAGVGPIVVDSLPEENVLLIAWIDAKTLHAEDLQSHPRILQRIAHTLKALHTGPGFEGHFHFPTIRKNYLKTVIEAGYFLPDQYLDFDPFVSQLENIIAKNPENLVPCNNDLLAENFLDDGKKIWIIDYEYSGQNQASFEIGNLAGETALDDAQLTELCDAYWQKHIPSKIARAMAWSMITRYGWVLWASIQEAISPIDFDFRAWGLRKWDSVLPELIGKRYQQVLENLKNTKA